MLDASLAYLCWVIGPFSCPEATAKGQVKGARFVLTNFWEAWGLLARQSCLGHTKSCWAPAFKGG